LVSLPLTAELAGDRLRGRYMAVNGFSWQLGFILGPAVCAALMTVEPLAVWIAAAGACVAGGVVAVRLEQRLRPRADHPHPDQTLLGQD
jgi:MFS family permease